MSTRDYILRFLNSPEAFAAGASDPDIWVAALERFAAPLLEAGGGPELRSAQDLAWRGLASTRAGLILGPPGTGKTHLLAWLIVGYILARRAAGQPARVFVSAFTRNAIGNLLDGVAARVERHAPEAFEVHYLGSKPPAGLSTRIRHRESVSKAEGEAAFADIGAEAVVVGASVWQLHRLLTHRKAPGDGVVAPLFDLVCIDEASQLVLSQGLMAMSGLKPGGRLVVAGDDRQLPPIRAGRDVNVGDRQLGGSLYAFLKSGGAPEFALEETFRLNAPLTTFPEKTFYRGQYRSADAAKEARLPLKPDWRDGLEPWEAYALDPDWPIAVLVHDGPSAASSNPFEAWASARLLGKLAERLIDVTEADGAYKPELWRERIAAVSPHRAQTAAIRNALPAPLRPNAFVETVDRIQGKERDAVVLSYCVADTEFALAEADFIFAPERLNVAVTRARHKLVVMVSRRLLDAAPTDEEQLGKAELLREFVFGADLKREVEIIDQAGSKVAVQIRLVGFEDSPDLIDPPVKAPEAALATDPLSEEDRHLLQAVRDLAMGNAYGTATNSALEARIGRKPVLPGLARLQAHGHVELRQQVGQHGGFWTARPQDPPKRIFPIDYETVKGRAEEVITQSKRGSKPPFYDEVRRQFAWVDGEGRDVARPAFDRLRDEGLIRYESDGERLRIAWTGTETLAPLPDLPEAPPLSDRDFAVLNALEALEAKRINFGVFESWTSAASLADGSDVSRAEVQAALGRLAANGWVLFAGEGRVRSRMAELAREVRYVKQRFARDDAEKRPFLVRSLKVELRDRDKPLRSEPMAAVFDGLAAEVGGMHADALAALRAGLEQIWGDDASIAGFQRRSLEALTRAWAGGGGDDSFVISADTGAGKTEAAALPLIAGAAADRMAGIRGVRALLAYPRIRLATNQAQRLVRYAALLARQPGAPTLTVGIQFKGTPGRLDALQSWDLVEGWRALSDIELVFPLFGCPECGKTLHLHRNMGEAGADRLTCVACDWSFSGWVGSKQGLRSAPPALFIITTDSLHQWMHNGSAGRIFGDDTGYAPPRALVADEIHLYSHIHGAQVALTLQRLAARVSVNSPGGPGLLMVGMSATLGDPAHAWSRLCGRANVVPIAALPDEKQVNPRGREYFYFIQPEVESRGADIAGASTTIQSLMCLAHGMRRRTDEEGGFRSVVFLDSIDKVRRLHGDYMDAEEGKELAAYRTRKYPEDPATGELVSRCCGDPYGCDRFQGGECWVFAANDPAQVGAQGLRRPGQPLSVIDRPVTSASTGRVEDAIKAADVVFATSSLEVGYDDPDITLVYQHYAPQNLASFVQRKGRGGRASDDRPITAVTLSLYSSRDSWWFRRPWTMLDPTGFDSPLNPANYFVRRGQILSTMLDAFARHERRHGPFDPRRPTPAAIAAAEDLVRRVFGRDVWRDYADDLPGLWSLALKQCSGAPDGDNLPQLRKTLDWAPDLLFDAINLPRLNIIRPGERDTRPEDISLAVASTAPGGATRRYHPVEVDWRPPVDGRGPWLAPADYASAEKLTPFGGDASAWLERLPEDARRLLPDLEAEYVRPRQITLERLGQMHGATWIPDFALDADDRLTPAKGAAPQRQISHQSRSQLRGFPIVKPDEGAARPLTRTGLETWVTALDGFVGDGVGGKRTGLGLARVFWGADAELILAGPPREVVCVSQVFTAPGKASTLHGYHVQTEGVRYRLDPARLNAFVSREAADLAIHDDRRKRVIGALIRWKVESGAQALGLNLFQMRRAGELILSALADPAYLDRLRRIAFLWDAREIADLFEEVRADLLACHPLLSPERVRKVAEAFADDRLKPVLAQALAAADDPVQIEAWIRSAVIHGLALRLKDSFVHLGHGEDRQVLAHAALPLQFGVNPERSDDIILCEVGSYGDGTTRAFIERQEAARGHWRDGFLSDCPNAAEDAALDRLFALQEHHDVWRNLDPNDPALLRELAARLGLDPEAGLPAAVLRALFGVEAVGSERFNIYDLVLEVRDATRALQARLTRTPSAWEVTSAVVKTAEAWPDSIAGRLLTAYAGLEEGLQEEALSAQGRLADQVYRLSARLCVDGCPACVHRPSDLMSEGLMESSTSRTLLQRYLCETP